MTSVRIRLCASPEIDKLTDLRIYGPRQRQRVRFLTYKSSTSGACTKYLGDND